MLDQGTNLILAKAAAAVRKAALFQASKVHQAHPACAAVPRFWPSLAPEVLRGEDFSICQDHLSDARGVGQDDKGVLAGPFQL